MKTKILGIDIGGTKTAVCVGTPEGKILLVERIPTADDSFQSYCKRLDELCQKVLNDEGTAPSDVSFVGISAPGPLNVEEGTLLELPNAPELKNVPIVEAVGKMCGGQLRSVVMNNDANAAAQAEFLFGEYKGTDNLVYLTFSTGMGAGIISGGKLVQGVTDMGGEVGHMTLDIGGELCGCGKRGCFEAYVGGRIVAERLGNRIREEGISTAILHNAGGDPDNVDFIAFANAVSQGDEFACMEWEKLIERLAQGVSTLVMTLNPSVILLGTIAVHNENLVLPPLRAALREFTWKWPLDACTIAASTLGGEIGTYGALAVGAGAMNDGS